MRSGGGLAVLPCVPISVVSVSTSRVSAGRRSDVPRGARVPRGRRRACRAGTGAAEAEVGVTTPPAGPRQAIGGCAMPWRTPHSATQGWSRAHVDSDADARHPRVPELRTGAQLSRR